MRKNFITRVITNNSYKTNVLEIAYDLCERTSNMIFVSEDGIDAGGNYSNL